MSYHGTEPGNARNPASYVYAEQLGGVYSERKGSIVGVNLGLYGGHLSWVFSEWRTGTNFQFGGVLMENIVPNMPTRVQIHGRFDGARFPSDITITSTNTAIKGAVTPVAPGDTDAWCEITDGLSKALSTRDIFLFGKDFIAGTLFRMMGRVRDSQWPLSLSLLVDGYGKYFIPAVIAKPVAKAGTVVRLKMRTPITEGSDGPGWEDETLKADDIFMHAVVPFAFASSEVGRVVPVQVAGPVESATLQGSVTTTKTNTGIAWSAVTNTTQVPSKYYRQKVYAIDDGLGAGITHNIHMLGRIFVG